MPNDSGTAAIVDPRVLASGVRTVARGNDPLRLDGSRSLWVVLSGRVDVFLTTDNGAGARQHLFRVESGHALFGWPASGGAGNGARFIAVGGPGTELLELTHANATASLSPQDLQHYIDLWVLALSTSAVRGPTRASTRPLQPGSNIQLRPDEVVAAFDETLWIRTMAGTWTYGRAGSNTPPDLTHPCPLAGALWLTADSPCELEAIPTAALVAGGDALAALDAFNAWFSGTMQAGSVAIEADELQRLTQRIEADRRSLASGVAQLAAAASDDVANARATAPLAGDELLTLCRLVTERSGIVLTAPPPALTVLSIEEKLAAIATASGVPMRRVRLVGAWWKGDCGALLGFRSDSKEPVALLQVKHGYVEFTAQGQQREIDRATAGSLESSAITFYRPLPARAISFRELLRFGVAGSGRDLSVVAVLGLVISLVGLLVPVMTGVLFDDVIPAADRTQLMQIAMALVVAALVGGAFRIAQGLAVLRVQTRMDVTLQSALWDRLLNLPVDFFRQYTAGDLAVRAGGIAAAREMISLATVTALLTGIFSVTQLGLLFYYDVSLALLGTGLAAVAVTATAATALALLRRGREVAQRERTISGRVFQFLSGISKLRVAAAESRAFRSWANLFSSQRTLTYGMGTVSNRLQVFQSIFPILASAALFAWIISGRADGLTTGQFLAFNAAFMTFIAMLPGILYAVIAVQQAVPQLEGIRPILEAIPEVAESHAAPGQLSGAIEVSHVSFRYAKDLPLVLHDVSLQIRAGEFVAFVGPSGSGKSTIVRMLLGFERPETGTVYFDGQDIGGLDRRAVRRQMGVVLQDGELITGDILTNIAGGHRITPDQAMEAAAAAGFADDLASMPMGLWTIISEGGGNLSGGQQQRLLIARAIVTKPRIILFDEATSALDNPTQAIVSDNLETLKATRIVVAHRLSTIRHADTIYVVDAGRIVQRGNYEELVGQEGLFRTLVQRQLA